MPSIRDLIVAASTVPTSSTMREHINNLCSPVDGVSTSCHTIFAPTETDASVEQKASPEIQEKPKLQIDCMPTLRIE